MKYRIAVWASVGFLVVCGWNLYFLVTTPPALTPAEPFTWMLVQVTCPIAFASFHFHFEVSVYWVLLANAAAYALAGVIFEMLRRRLNLAR